jgi:hypothetical protein
MGDRYFSGNLPTCCHKKNEGFSLSTPVGSGGAFKLVLMIVAQVAKRHRVELPGQLLAFEGLAL